MKAKFKRFLPLAILLLVITTLTGCGKYRLETPMTQSQITKEFLSNTESLLKTRNIQTAKEQNTSQKSKNFNKYLDRQAKSEQKKVQKSFNKLQKSSKYSGYPKDVYQYSKEVLNYINETIKGMSTAKARKLYHNITKQAITVASETDNKKVTNYVSSVVSNDTLMKAKVGRNQLNKAKGTQKRQNSNKPESIKNIDINYRWGTVIIIICVLLCVTIFMQPNKSDDNSDALMDESLKPKPRGYTLLLYRSTEVLTVLLIIIMVAMNMV